MKKIFTTMFLSLALFACDNGTNPTEPVSQKKDTVVVHDTVKTKIDTVKKDSVKVVPDTIHKKYTLKDTTIKFSAKMQIVGKIQEKNSSGNIKGAFSAIACLEKSKMCTKTNSSGQFAFIKNTSRFSARTMSDDTLITPELVPVPRMINDTTWVIDTVLRNDTSFIFYNMYVDTNYAFNDSVNIYSNSKSIMEIPVTSWKFILPDAYVVQRNISGVIIKNVYFSELKSVEGIYWNKDSVALTIPLELSDNKLSYSGFLYQPYNDSSFKTGNRINNIFVRVLDNNDSVFGLTNIVTYSERTGDLNSFDPIILGNIQRYPKPSYFRVIKDGDNVSRIITNTNSQYFYNPNGYDLDSLFVRQQFSTYFDTVNNNNRNIIDHFVDSVTINNKSLITSIDSIGVYFESDSNYSARFQLVPSEFDIAVHPYIIVKIVPGKNIFKFKHANAPQLVIGNKKVIITHLDIRDAVIHNIKTLVYFKQ